MYSAQPGSRHYVSASTFSASFHLSYNWTVTVTVPIPSLEICLCFSCLLNEHWLIDWLTMTPECILYFTYFRSGHILSRVYNRTETKKSLSSPFWKKISYAKISAAKSRPTTTQQNYFLWPLFIITSKFFVFHPCFPPSHLQSYNYSSTIHLLQLQMTSYNCRNCDQLHIKICPAFVKSILSISFYMSMASTH